ncbi:MAG: cyclic-di-AMP receptor, partial [Pygmaiobacter massiliensis]
MKMITAIVNKEDAGAVSSALTKAGYMVTKLPTTGGFLLAGNSTLMIGTEDEKVDRAIQIISDHSKQRKE